MKQREMDRLMQHFDRYFEQSDCLIIHPIVDDGYHIDVLFYKPTEKYPFWKLVTMGASDYRMPRVSNTISRYNEYMMFVDKEEDLNNNDLVMWYRDKLVTIATYACYNRIHITYGHSLEWKNYDADDEMVAAFIEFPQVVENIEMLRCKLGMFKVAACLQTILLNRDDLKLLRKIGPYAFSEYLYPNDGGKRHFLSERHRSDKF